jgi:ribonuclease III
MTRVNRRRGSTAEGMRRIQLAESVIGHEFHDKDLVLRALTHPSAVEERDPDAYYERLEFLGDSIVGFLIAEEIYRRFPSMDEGGLTRIRVSVVSRSALARVAAELGLADAIVVGQSELGTGGRGLKSALGNVYEALVAALYLDAGMAAARDWVLATLGPLISEDVAASLENPKSELQEKLQARGETPVYRLVSQEGPPHARTFTVEVVVGGVAMGSGSGRTKKEAEAAAAAAAIAQLAKARRSRPPKGS